MRISLNWLKDYIDFKSIDVEDLANCLTMAGLEVEAIEHIKEKAQHISLVKLSEASLKIKDSLLLDPETIVGLIHSEENFRLARFGDLGFGGLSQEIISFAPHYFLNGVPENLAEVSDFDDIIFSLNVTPNRSDALSHLGVSRELAALLELSPRAPLLSVPEMAGPTHEKAVVEINNSHDCPRYALRILENIQLEPSPPWLQLRLLACGIRPINNIVDVTNYVMLSRGQPLHAYDYDKLKKENSRVKIIVRRALEGEKLLTLDNKNLSLTSADIVIADTNNPIALAGVIGGALSAVSPHTTNILLESAYFSPPSIRMSARYHQVSSESSYRFERGADPNAVVDALNYAARLLVEISAAKACREPIDAYRQRIDPIEIKMRLDRAQSILGIEQAHFDQELLRRRFGRLGIETVAKRGDAIYFRVPTFRSDLTREIDLIEEAARMIGYDKVNETIVGSAQSDNLFANKPLERSLKKMRNSLVARGFCESMNYAFLSKELHEDFFGDSLNNFISIMNPLSERFSIMRMSLVPALVKNLVHNQRNQEKSIQLFESGTVFLGKREAITIAQPMLLHSTLDQDSFCIEKQLFAGVIGGLSPYSAFDHPPHVFDFYSLKGIVSDCFRDLGLDDRAQYAAISYEHDAQLSFMHPGESARIMLRNHDKPVGHLGKLHPDVAESLDVNGDVFVFELDLALIAQHSQDVVRFANFSRFPLITRDVALLADEQVLIGDIMAQAYEVKNAQKILSDVRVFDIYRGKNIPTGKKSVALSLTLQDAEKTLTDEEAELFMKEFLSLVELKTKAHVR
jgi:phenylalanyl-tRNA synthetase beta chain